MTPHPAVQAVIDEFGHDPLRHVVLLKQLLAYPEHVRVHRVAGRQGTATLVLLDVSANPYDRQTYPKAAVAAFICSDHPDLTASLLSHLPAPAASRGGIVFKLSSDADLAPVAARYPVTRRTAFVSFTASGGVSPAPDVQLTAAPGDEAFRLFETQGHDRAWLEPLLRSGKAFACVAGRAALAELAGRGLAPRYQAEEHNTASIALARSAGLVPFLTIVHYAHDC